MGLFSMLKEKNAGLSAEQSEVGMLDEHTVAARAKSEFVPKRQTHFVEAA